ncbi:MAG TPA: adenylosuccinate synthase [Thermoanaerobaculia bacterium]|nr:adenylosuccinate synthase [Thermoanaerobaculia bacterium]
MVNAVVVGLQWGDEGKGKIVDLLCPAFDAVVRYQGGHNAGHTVKFGDRHFALQLIPSGICHPGLDCVLGNGMVVAPDAFFEELGRLAGAGVETAGRLFVSSRAHLLLPSHALLDRARERAAGVSQIGTTARGIGPAYEAKVARSGLRLGDLLEPGFADRLAAQLARTGAELGSLGAEERFEVEEIRELCRAWAERLAPLVTDTAHLLHGWLAAGRRLLFEGAQGALLDVDHGTYPYVTSSNATAGGAATGTGVPPAALGCVLGVLKAYTTRVGGGPFVGELAGEPAEFLRRRGNEFGTVTGRPRRCGWFDAVAARYSQRINGANGIALTKLDVLDEFDEIPVCVGYRHRGEILRGFPASPSAQAEAEPVYRTVRGWRRETVGIRAFEDLPAAARDYVAVLEEEVGAPVWLVSTGPRREETILRGDAGLEPLLGARRSAVEAGLAPAG